MMHVVLSAGVLTFSALFMRRESRMSARIEALNGPQDIRDVIDDWPEP
jgi:hypothetical protein